MYCSFIKSVRMHTQPVVLLAVLSLVVCSTFARSLPGHEVRVRRAASDQRIAELQALIALANGGSVGHGQFDPFSAGKRKRSDDFYNRKSSDDYFADDDNYNTEDSRSKLLQRVIERLTDRS